MKHELFLSIIIPCYNEASRGNSDFSLVDRLGYLKFYFEKFERSHELIFVSDGSTDDTVIVIEQYIHDNNLKTWHLLVDVDNHGKGYSIRKGIEFARGQMILFMDADLAIPLPNIQRFVDDGDAHSCIIGNRYSEKKNIYDSFKRSFISQCSKMLIRPLLPIKVADTQCGFKLFPREVVVRNLKVFKVDRWLFDVELLMVLMHSGIKVIEKPLNWDNMIESTVSNKAVISSLRELCSLYLRKWSLKRAVQKNWV